MFHYIFLFLDLSRFWKIEPVRHFLFIEIQPKRITNSVRRRYHAEKIAEADAVRERVGLGKGRPSR